MAKPEHYLVQVTAYNNHVVIFADPEAPETEEWVPCGNGKFGCVLINTKGKLGISQEALELLRKIKRGRDSLGDLDCFKTADNRWCFSWIGGLARFIDIAEAETSRDYQVPPESVFDFIPNDVPIGAIDLINLKKFKDFLAPEENKP